MKRVKNSKDMIKELKKGNDVWFDERMTELTTNVDRYKLGYLKGIEEEKKNKMKYGSLEDYETGYKLGKLMTIEEVEKMIDENSEFVYTEFEGDKHINSEGFKIIKQKLREKKEK